MIAFDDRYSHAREIARYPGNHVRVCDGEDLLGRPHLDTFGVPIRDGTGRVLWAMRPRGGFVPLSDGSWERVAYLARELQCRQQDAAGTLGMRVTPEVRVERMEALSVLVRTLTVEMTVLTVQPLQRQTILDFGATLAPILRPWYPLHETVISEWIKGPHQPAQGGDAPHQSVLYRFRGRHEDPHRPLGMTGETWTI